VPTSYLALRLRGGQFAIAMWVIAETFRLLVQQFESLGGGTGKSLTGLNAYAPADRQAYTYWVALIVMLALLVGLGLILRGRLGTTLQAIRDDEVGASSLGVRTMFGKRLIFLYSALGCGAAGALIAVNSLRIQPDSIFGVQWSAYMIFMVLLGGLGTYEGAIVGALVFFGIQETFADQGSWYLIGLGVVAIAVALVAPRGLWGTFAARRGIQLMPVGYRLRGLPAPGAPSAPPAPAPVGDASG
jgi:branched-chain amino acid transport system permease protein